MLWVVIVHTCSITISVLFCFWRQKCFLCLWNLNNLVRKGWCNRMYSTLLWKEPFYFVHQPWESAFVGETRNNTFANTDLVGNKREPESLFGRMEILFAKFFWAKIVVDLNYLFITVLTLFFLGPWKMGLSEEDLKVFAKNENVQCHHRKELRKVSPSITPPPLFKKRKWQKMHRRRSRLWKNGNMPI